MSTPCDKSFSPDEVGAAMYERDSAAHWMGIELVSIGEGTAVLEMTVRSEMLNGHSICHGGIIFALADTAFAYACNSRNVKTVAMSCLINFLISAEEGDRLMARAQEVSLKGRTGIYDIAVSTQSGDEIAQFRGTSRSVRGSVVEG